MVPSLPREGQNGRNLRKRRAQIIHSRNEDARMQAIIQDSIVKNEYSTHMLKTFIVVFTALLCTVGVVLTYTQPLFMKRFWKKPIPPFHIMTRYPRGIVVERDLPRFFRQYSIATADNVAAQEAVRKVLRSRQNLRLRSGGRIKSSLKAWDDSNVDQLLMQGSCGDDFEVAYTGFSQEQTKESMLMWCLMAARATEGFFVEAVEIVDSPLFLTRNRGIVVKRQSKTGVSDGYGALSTSFYMHPRSEKASSVDWIPAKILATIISSSKEESEESIRELSERMLYDLVVSQGNENDFVILEEICQDNRPDRSIARSTDVDSHGCYFVVPNKYGGNFHDDD